MPERPRRRRWHVAIAGSVLAAGALVTWQLASRSEREPEIPAVTPVLDAAPVAVVPADAAAVDAEAIADAVEMVELELLGLPEGTQVKTAADGVTIGTAPGKIRLPRSTAIVALRLEHPAYVPKTDLMVRAVPGQPPFRLTLVKKTTTTTTPLSGFGTDQ